MEALIDLGLKLLQAIILAVVPIVSGFLVQFIRAKAAEAKQGKESTAIWDAITLVEDTVARVVAYVSQTYVDNLKNGGKFDEEEQVVAFNKAYSRVVELISEEQRAFFESLFGNFSEWISVLIESAVRKQKTQEISG